MTAPQCFEAMEIIQRRLDSGRGLSIVSLDAWICKDASRLKIAAALTNAEYAKKIRVTRLAWLDSLIEEFKDVV